jgi:hypothetical protein
MTKADEGISRMESNSSMRRGKAVTFKCSGVLRARMNGESERQVYNIDS